MEDLTTQNSAPMPPGAVLPTICPQCHQPVSPSFYYCPNCGKKLSDPPLSTSGFTQTWIYAVSILLPPLGLWPAVKYIKNPDPGAKQIGWIAVVLTVISTGLTLWLTFAFLNSYINSISQSLGGIY